MTDNDLLSKPNRLYNTEEMNVLTIIEKDENISLIACCNTEGTLLPGVLILKENKKLERLLILDSQSFADKVNDYHPLSAKSHNSSSTTFEQMVLSQLKVTWLKRP